TAAAIELQMMIRLRRFLLPLPLPSTTASCLIPNLRTVIHLLLREKRGNSSSKNCCRDGACPVSLAASYQGIALARKFFEIQSPLGDGCRRPLFPQPAQSS